MNNENIWDYVSSSLTEKMSAQMDRLNIGSIISKPRELVLERWGGEK